VSGSPVASSPVVVAPVVTGGSVEAGPVDSEPPVVTSTAPELPDMPTPPVVAPGPPVLLSAAPSPLETPPLLLLLAPSPAGPPAPCSPWPEPSKLQAPTHGSHSQGRSQDAGRRGIA
jgi:protein TonB